MLKASAKQKNIVSKTVYCGKFISRFKHIGEVCHIDNFFSGLGYNMTSELIHL